MTNKHFHLIAHRGISSEAPENTLTAFRKAIDLGVDFFEFDVQLSKDQVPVVIHDSSLERTTNCSLPTPVSHLTLAELKNLDAGSWFSDRFAGERIPTLEEVMTLARGKTGLMVEIKDTPLDPELVVNKILPIILRNSSESSIFIASFSKTILALIQKNYPKLQLIALADDEVGIKKWLEMGFKHLCLEESLLTPKQLRSLKEASCIVWTYTVDDPIRASELVSLLIDGIVTNIPQRMKEQGLKKDFTKNL